MSSAPDNPPGILTDQGQARRPGETPRGRGETHRPYAIAPGRGLPLLQADHAGNAGGRSNSTKQPSPTNRRRCRRTQIQVQDTDDPGLVVRGKRLRSWCSLWRKFNQRRSVNDRADRARSRSRLTTSASIPFGERAGDFLPQVFKVRLEEGYVVSYGLLQQIRRRSIRPAGRPGPSRFVPGCTRAERSEHAKPFPATRNLHPEAAHPPSVNSGATVAMVVSLGTVRIRTSMRRLPAMALSPMENVRPASSRISAAPPGPGSSLV